MLAASWMAATHLFLPKAEMQTNPSHSTEYQERYYDPHLMVWAFYGFVRGFELSLRKNDLGVFNCKTENRPLHYCLCIELLAFYVIMNYDTVIKKEVVSS